MKYDIFISYRRTSFETASLIAEKLKSKGFRVFFDIETLRSGKFNEQLYNVIEQCNDVVIILPENALDRCNNPDDWVRKEICHAMKHHKNIIPVMLAGFEWPSPMPADLEELCNYQAITAGEREFFDLSIQRLTNYLSSKPKKRLFKLISRIAIILAISFSIIATLYFSFLKIAVPECQNITNEMTKSLVALDLMASDINNLYGYWNKFNLKVQNCTPETKETLTQEMLETIDTHRNYILSRQSIIDTTKFHLSDYQSFLIGLYKIDRAEISAALLSYNITLSESLDLINGMQQVITTEDRIPLQEKLIQAQKEGLICIINADYYAYLEIISSMPKEAQKQFIEISSKLTNLPNGTPLGLKSEDYKLFYQKEYEKYEQIFNQLGHEIESLDIELSAIELKLNEIDNQISNDQPITDDEHLIKEMQSLNKGYNNIQTLNNNYDKQFLEMREKLDNTHEVIKAQCQFQDNDDQYSKWGKIVHWAKFMSTSCDFYYQYIRDGLQPIASATPADIYADLENLLNQYQNDHPETTPYVTTAKAFYKEVSLGKRQLYGTIIMGFKGNAEHPIYKIGDIVVEKNGKKVNSAKQINEASISNNNDTSKFLRIENGVLTETTANIPESDILIGYLQLTEIQ